MNDQKRHMAWKDTKNKSKQLLVGNNAVSIIQTYTMDDNEDNKDNHDENRLYSRISFPILTTYIVWWNII